MYTTELLDSHLSCAYCADIYTHFDNPHDVQECANSLSKAAQEKGEEIYSSVRANEVCFFR